jgi:hypothetical protein
MIVECGVFDVVFGICEFLTAQPLHACLQVRCLLQTQLEARLLAQGTRLLAQGTRFRSFF